MLFALDLAAELVAIQLLGLQGLVAPGFEMFEAAVEPARVAAVEPDGRGREIVKQAAVVARKGGMGDVQLHAYVVPAEGSEMDVREVRTRLGRVLPEYMLPAAVAVLEEMPLTSSGKVNRRLLPEIEAWVADAGETAPRCP